jgi:hypothetical protein
MVRLMSIKKTLNPPNITCAFPPAECQTVISLHAQLDTSLLNQDNGLVNVTYKHNVKTC